MFCLHGAYILMGKWKNKAGKSWWYEWGRKIRWSEKALWLGDILIQIWVSVATDSLTNNIAWAKALMLGVLCMLEVSVAGIEWTGGIAMRPKRWVRGAHNSGKSLAPYERGWNAIGGIWAEDIIWLYV
jgi:hypothetical protein